MGKHNKDDPLYKYYKEVDKTNRKRATKRNIKIILAYTLLLPYTIYFKIKERHGNSIEDIRHNRIMKNKDRYKHKVLDDMLKYIDRKSIPGAIRRSKGAEITCTIFMEVPNDISADFYIKEFITMTKHGMYKKYNSKGNRYYEACYRHKEPMEYDWFMDRIEEYYRKKGLHIEKGTLKTWYDDTEYLEITYEREGKLNDNIS